MEGADAAANAIIAAGTACFLIGTAVSLVLVGIKVYRWIRGAL